MTTSSQTALRELEAGGVDLTAVTRRAGTTGVAIITVDEAGENTIALSPGANAHADAGDAFPTAPSAPATRCFCRWKCRSPRTMPPRPRRAPPAPVSSSRSPPMRRCRPDELAAFDMVIVNEHEAADLARHLAVAGGTPEETVTALAARLGRTVIATLGPDGAVAADGKEVIRVPALQVTPVDTTGAGDTFCGVLAAWLDEGASFRTALARAAVAGSLAVTKEGAQPSFPTRAEIQDASALACQPEHQPERPVEQPVGKQPAQQQDRQGAAGGRIACARPPRLQCPRHDLRHRLGRRHHRRGIGAAEQAARMRLGIGLVGTGAGILQQVVVGDARSTRS